MAKAGAALVPTLTVAHLMASEWREWGLPEAVIPRLHQVAGAMEHSIGLARAAGVTIGSGTDLIGPRQNRRGLELVLRARVEDPMTAISRRDVGERAASCASPTASAPSRPGSSPT